MKLSERSVFQKQDMIFLRFGATIAFQVRYQGIKGIWCLNKIELICLIFPQYLW